MDQLNFRLAEEKNFHSEVLLFSFNPEHDIIVVCSANGDVIAYQAYIRKVWGLGTRNQRKKAVSLAWRPDGQILAVTFSNRSLVLASVQDGHILLTETIGFEIRSCTWIERLVPSQQDDNQFETVPINNYLPVLVDLPSINRARKHVVDPPDDLFSLEKQTKLNILVLFGQNEILLRAFGLWPLYSITRSSLPSDLTLLSVTMSASLDNICILTRYETSIKYTLIECTSFVSDYHSDYFQLIRSICRVKSLLLYNDKIWTTLVDLTIKCFSEFQLRINAFCEKTRQQLKEWTFQCDLMALLATGNCSENMQQNFFGSVFDYGYAKKLVTTFEETRTKSKELIILFGRTIEHIFGYLVEIKGLQQWYGKFDSIILDPYMLETCLSNAGSLLLKINEFTDFMHEMSDVYIFFLRWLGFVAHQIHTSRHNTSTHHDEQIECTDADWDHLIEFIDTFCSSDEPVLDLYAMYLKWENLPESIIRDSTYRKIFEHLSLNNKNPLFSPKPKKSLAGAYQELKQSINKIFEARIQNSACQINKASSILASIPYDPTLTLEFDHRRGQTSLNYILQHSTFQFHVIVNTYLNKQCLVRLIDLQYILTPYRSITNFKIYDDEKLALVCTNISDVNNGQTNETTLFNTNHQSNLTIINLKSLFDSHTSDFLGNNQHPNVLLSYPLKDIPAKLTVDGRRNLIAVWSKNRKLTTFIHNPSDDNSQSSSASSQVPMRMDDESTLIQSGSITTMISSQESTR